MQKRAEYTHHNGKFIIKNYNFSKTFSSFFPGLAGKKGIPLWAFYVNRAQLVSGFGVEDKNHPISLFHPANKAYEYVASDGFRTFLKNDQTIYEPFSPVSTCDHKMEIEAHKVAIEEINENFGVLIRVEYFGLPEASFPALVRQVTIENITDHPIELEMLDGIGELLPAGVRNMEFKASSNLLQSWMDVDALNDGFGFFKLRGSTGDDVEVNEVNEGNFFLGFDHKGAITPIVDNQLVFAHDTSKRYPFGFENRSIKQLKKTKQVTKNKVPCAFIPGEMTLEANEKRNYYALIGHTHSLKDFKLIKDDITDPDYVKKKEQRAKALIDDLQKDVDTNSGIPVFDAYIKQNYLDNLLRGGYPLKIGKEIYHIYARRHGDLERDYNFFSLSPHYYSTGPGNFRDVCQNRRLDAFIHREVESFDVVHFASLIQMDGFNPLSVESITYRLHDEVREKLVEKHFKTKKDIIDKVLSGPFTPGDIVNTVERNDIRTTYQEDEYLPDVLNHSKRRYEATFGEGYWIDHFTYLLDMVEVYEGMYPDRFDQLYLDEDACMYFKSPIRVLKQTEKALLVDEDKVRQYKNIERTDEQERFVTYNGRPYKTNLFVKLWILVLNKFAQLDPEGIGVEMEAGKPGWNDAMNGLPGLFGSGVSETIEVKRILDFLLEHGCPSELKVPLAVHEFAEALSESLDYENRLVARETYRDAIANGQIDALKELDEKRCESLLENMQAHINRTLLRIYEEEDGMLPTYLIYDVTEYEKTGKKTEANGNRTLIHPQTFKRRSLPFFLEAPARLLKTDFPKAKLKKMVGKIKQSPLYDKKLRQYKTSVPLKDESHEIGRIKAFTPGWLERESNFLHMTYKYLLGLLKSGMYDTFYKELKNNLVCFMDPSVYGRSTLENSSFLATSNNPDPSLHGQGFFARLSGSTAEALNMWAVMMIGEKPFRMQDGDLIFSPDPKLHASFFRDDGNIAFNFMRDVRIIYHNPDGIHAFARQTLSVKTLIGQTGNEIKIEGGVVRGEEARKIRDGHYKEIHIEIH